ncbi:DegV family protein [Mycoplasmopsis columbina]|uniref:DegV family protein n=1 Tax=Mycoplasmopsis columbina TaxID=114881 RepID=UPI0004A6D4C1|nr:DegV family protein [Mycoplasmopsis columbina]VEU76961.1 degV-like protein [Mycoplasmopsis columbina]
MKKIGFIVDSFSCLSKEEANQKGFGYFPFRLDLDDKVYEDGVDLSSKDILEIIDKSQDYKTSLPRLDIMEEVISQMSKEYDDVIYLPISSTLSGSLSAANNFKSEFSNFHIYDNQYVGEQFLEVIKYIKREYEKGVSLDIIFEKLNDFQKDTIVYILPLNLNYAIKGGRISGVKKFLLKAFSKVKLVPFIKFANSQNSTAGIARGTKGAIIQIVEKIIDFTNLKNIDEINQKYNLYFIHGLDQEFNQMVLKIVKETKLEINSSKLNSGVIAVHTGPEAISLSIMPKINQD